MRTTVRFSRYRTNGVTLHVAEAGPEDGPLLVLLHGFPEFWYGWRHQIDGLAEAGYRVLAPDQRGYNLSDRPREIAAYDLDLLARDILDLADAVGRRRFSLVGHDWGASVGWWLAARHADRLDRFAATNAPHPSVWLEAMRDTPEQRRKSRYVQLLRLPLLPEFLMRQRNFKALADALRASKRPEACSESDLAQYRAAWSAPSALTGMVNWYRALLRKELPPSHRERIGAPTLIIWGRDDPYAITDLAERSARLCNSARIAYLDASHWVQHDEPDRVTRLLLDFLRA
jgi:epoxide hydrolase 4